MISGPILWMFPTAEKNKTAPPKMWPQGGQLLKRIDSGRNLWVGLHFSHAAAIRGLDAFLPVFLKIRDRGGQLVWLRPNRAQQEFAQRRSERNIILKARQVGMTTFIAARFFLSTILKPGTVTLQVAHTLESAQQIFRIVYRFLKYLREDVGDIILTSRANVRELAFANTDSRYIVDTAGNRNAGRGLTIQNLHASEVALWPGNPRETMAGLLAAVPPGGTIEIESTPHGGGGYFHEEWIRSTEGRARDAFTPHFFPWWFEDEYKRALPPGENPLFNEEERRLMGREGLSAEQIEFRRHLRATYDDLAPQEFAEDPSACFLVSGRPVFDVQAIEARLKEVADPITTRQNDVEMVWRRAQPGRSYIIGADVAEGGGGRRLLCGRSD